MRLGKAKPEITDGCEILAHKITLRPNRLQAEYFAKAVGTARFAYNWGLDEWECQYRLATEDADIPLPDWMALDARLNSIKAEEFPWMGEVTKHATQHALTQLGTAYSNYFAGRSARPTFHRKFRHDSFYLDASSFKLNGKRIKIPKLGWVRMTQPLRFDGKINSATISRVAGQWFVSINVTMRWPEPLVRATNEVGLDLGVSSLITLSDGTKVPGFKPDRKLEAKISRRQRSLSRKQLAAKARLGLSKTAPLPRGARLPVSKNAEKDRLKLARLHQHQVNVRRDGLHKLTTRLAKTYTFIAMEDLNTLGLVKNHHLAKAILGKSWGEFKRQLEYKSKRTGTTLVLVSRWFASSKICSQCGHKNADLKLSQRHWHCPCCHAFLDRDLNAAINLKREGLANLNGSTAWPAGSHVCGEDSSAAARLFRPSGDHLASSKQTAVA